MYDEDPERRREVHAVLAEGGDLDALVLGWGIATARRVIALVMTDYLAALRDADRQPPTEAALQVDDEFLDRYRRLWDLMLALSDAERG